MEKVRRVNLNSEGAAGFLVVVVSIAIAAYGVVVSTLRPLTALEGALFQAGSLVLGILGSYVFGRSSARAAAREIIRPHARSAFRRLTSLFEALGRLNVAVGERRKILQDLKNADGFVELTHVELSLDVLEAQVEEQLGTATAALEDWRDVVPDELRAMEDEAAARRREQGTQAPAAGGTTVA